MSKRLAIVMCGVAVIVAVLAVAVWLRPAAAKSAGWRLRFKTGQTFTYALQCSITSPHSRMTTSTTMAETVTSIADNGAATLETEAAEYVVTVGKDGVEKRSGPFDVTSRLRVSPNGLTTCPDNTGDASGEVAPNNGAFLPTFTPKPGDTWDLPSPIHDIVAHAQLVSISVDAGGHHVAQIDSLASGTIGAKQKAVSLKSTVMFDVDRGILVSRQTTMQMGSPVDVTTSDRQDLVKASD